MMSDEGAFIKELHRQASLWLRDGIISPQQKEDILARYNKPAATAVIPSKLIITLSILGALLLGAGVILFFSANWQAIPKWGKILLILSGMISSYGTGHYLCHEKGTYPKVGASFYLLGAIIFGAGIFLIAQAYNVSSNSAFGILIWGAGVLPVAYAVRLRPLLVLSIAAFLVWLFMEISPEIESHYGSVNIIPAVFLAAGVTLWGVGLLHRDFNSLSRLSLPYMAAGLPLTYLAAYVFTFKAAIGAAVVFTSSMLTLVISFGCVFVLSQTLRLFSKASRRVDETLLLLLMIVFVAAQYILPNLPYSHSHAAQMRPIFLLLFNLIYAASVLWLIYIGYVKQIPSYVNVGMWFFALDVLGRYVDILWGLLHTSLFFLVGGGLLIAMGVTLEKKRRKVLASFCTVGLTDAQ